MAKARLFILPPVWLSRAREAAAAGEPELLAARLYEFLSTVSAVLDAAVVLAMPVPPQGGLRQPGPDRHRAVHCDGPRVHRRVVAGGICLGRRRLRRLGRGGGGARAAHSGRGLLYPEGARRRDVSWLMMIRLFI